MYDFFASININREEERFRKQHWVETIKTPFATKWHIT